MERYYVHYPSGRKLTFEGNFKVGMIPDVDLFAVGYEDDGNQTVLLDPRGVIKNENGEIVYHPRDYIDSMMDVMSEWLSENPDWYPLDKES